MLTSYTWKQFLIQAFICLAGFSVSFSQGTIRGKISDENGEPAYGAMVILKAKPGIGTRADLDGNYSLHLADSTPQVLVISFLGYSKIETTVHPVNNTVVIRNFVMSPATDSLATVMVEVKAIKANDHYMEKFKMNSSATLDYISAPTMRNTGVSNVTEAVTKVTGVSTNSGGLITVRGIGDRYVKTNLNGSRIPTLDPFTNNIKLDLFPTGLVDNIIITKTASPDLPGDWAGAYLSVETKDYPDVLSINVETAFGYNNQSSFKEVLTSDHSPTDWLGYDNGYRNINHKTYAGVIGIDALVKNEYMQMNALGLGDYYKSLGITASTPWNTTYFNLGLVQLGLLENSQLDDPDAVKIARDKYYSSHLLTAFDNINAKGVEFSKSLPNNWELSTRKAPLNFSQSFSIGNQTRLFGKTLGFLAGFRYGSSTQFDPDAIASRSQFYYPRNDTLQNTSEVHQQSSVETNGWSALFNLAYKLNTNHSLSFLFMPNLTGVNNLRKGFNHREEQGDTIFFETQFYEERRQLVYQFKSEHQFPGTNLKIESNASYTRGESSAPDFKNVQYFRYPGGNYAIGGQDNPTQRFFRYLSENLLDSRISAELPLGKKPGLARKIRWGGAYQRLSRNADQYEYDINASKPFDGDLSEYFDHKNFEIKQVSNGTLPYPRNVELSYGQSGNPWDHNIGYSSIAAGFAMLDYSIIPSLRIAGGLRVEKSVIFTDVLKFDSLGLEANDPRRTGFNPGKLDELTYLPSVNFIYKLKKTEEAPVNIRLNYSRTVARPSIREISGNYAYDYQLRSYVVGNVALKMAQVNNYDLRLESYFKSGDNVSLSIFYKDFTNHIELIFDQLYTWRNVDNSYVKGIELEGKKDIYKGLELRANLTLVDSRSDLPEGPFQKDVKRTMYGQAPYVINGILSYNADSLGLIATVSYNLQGPKLVIPAFFSPDVYEHPRHLLDMKVSKTLGKNMGISLTIRDILSSPIKRTYRWSDGDWINDYDRYRYGTSYILAVSYKL